MKNKLLSLLYIIAIILSFIISYGRLHEVIENFNYKSLSYLFLNIFCFLLFSKWLVDNIKEKNK
jgi:uncharacterized membrane protein YbhN (UPF0104 family)